MSLDRTIWEHGESPINFLVLGAVVEGYTIPLVWMALDHTGNSSTRTQMWVVLRLLHLLPANRWQGLLADREFIGVEWFRFLRHQGIRRIIRLRHSDLIDDLSGEDWFSPITPGVFRKIGERVIVFGELLRVVATRSPAGDLVILATDFGVRQTWKLYTRRWTIECTFSSFKARGFDLERTGITDLARLERLFGLVTLAWMFYLKLGVWLSQTRPIHILKHGHRAVSTVRHSTQHLSDALRWKPERLATFLEAIIRPFSASGTVKDEVVIY